MLPIIDYKVSVPAVRRCEVVLSLRGEKMKAMKEFMYLGTVLCKHGGMEGEVRERAVKDRDVIGSLARIMRGRNVSIEVNRRLRNSILLPTLTCNWTQQSGGRAVEIIYLRGACGHIERKNIEEFVKKVYVNETVGSRGEEGQL